MDSESVAEPSKASSNVAPKTLRCLEFYSGIGGLHYSLDKACASLKATGLELSADVLKAFDINTIANAVYEHNFLRAVCPKTILSLTPAALDKMNASDIWLLSPPCQPYTRQGKQKDTEDPRAESFLHIISLLPELASPPDFILVENVVNFEISETRRRLVDALTTCHYHIQEFHLSPSQIGIPNSRMRYFLIASRTSQPHGAPTAQPSESTPLTSLPGSTLFGTTVSPLSVYLERVSDEAAFHTQYEVPANVLKKSGMSFDLVFPQSTGSCCFTKNYGRLVEGTGSVLQTADPEIKGIPNDPNSLQALKLRYFAPREIARIHGFPEDIFEGTTVTAKQAYALLGNSLSVTLVAEILEYLLTWEPLKSTP